MMPPPARDQKSANTRVDSALKVKQHLTCPKHKKQPFPEPLEFRLRLLESRNTDCPRSRLTQKEQALGSDMKIRALSLLFEFISEAIETQRFP